MSAQVDADRYPEHHPYDRVPQRFEGKVSKLVKSKNADARMSPATQTLLCDESEKLFASTSPRGAESDNDIDGGFKTGNQAGSQLSSENANEGEGTIMLRLAWQLKTIAARHSGAQTTI